MQTFRRPISRPLLLLSAATLGLTAGLAGCAGAAGDRQASSWPPRLNAADERMQAAESAAQRRDRALDESGATVHLDRPYH